VTPLRTGYQIRLSSPPEPPDGVPSSSRRHLLLIPVQPRPLHPLEPPDPPDPPDLRAPTPLLCLLPPPISQAHSNPPTPSTIPDPALLLMRSASAVLTRLDPPPRLTLVVRLAGFCSTELALSPPHCPTKALPQPRFPSATLQSERSRQETTAFVFVDQVCNSDESSFISPIFHIVDSLSHSNCASLVLWALPSKHSHGLDPIIVVTKYVIYGSYVLSTGSIVGISSVLTDCSSGVLPTYRCISEFTIAVMKYCQLTGVSSNSLISSLENVSKRSIISRSSFTVFLRLCSGRHVFMQFNATSTGSSAGFSSDYSDLVSRVFPTYRHISKPTSAVLEYRQLTGQSLNLPFFFVKINPQRSTVITTSRAISLVHSLSIAKELPIVFQTIIEALLKKLPFFFFDLNCLIYPFIFFVLHFNIKLILLLGKEVSALLYCNCGLSSF